MRLTRPTPCALRYDRTPEPLSPPSMRTACPSGARMRVASPWPTSMKCTWRSLLGAEVVTVVSGAEVTTVTTSAPSRDLQVHFIDVGQGDATLILAPDGQAVLIDGGESGSGVLSYLKAQGVGRVNLMIATHPHADHIGGLIDVLQALPVDEVVTNGQAHTTRTY